MKWIFQKDLVRRLQWDSEIFLELFLSGGLGIPFPYKYHLPQSQKYLFIIQEAFYEKHV
jgi:hypothetical protein